MIEDIKTQYSQVTRKTDFLIALAKELKRSPTTIRNHWFSAFWSIPEEQQPRTLELLKKTIKDQKDKKIAHE